MTVTLKPKVVAILEAQVTSGAFATIEDAVEAAVLGIGGDDEGLSADLDPRPQQVDRIFAARQSRR